MRTPSTPRPGAFAAAAALAGAALLLGPPTAATDPSHPLEPASTGGIAAVDRGLARLTAHRRLLVIGAHPDDEDNTLLTWVSRGLGGEAAYFALSRGEGGQNLVGPELGVGLGLLRTGELLAARRVEGTRQLFGRAFDFGYTRSLEETESRWPRALMLEDAVRSVRRFKPQVVVAIFPADERAGHGQHQLSAVIARAAFEGAGEPDRCPELTAAGLPPWTPQLLYRRAWSREEATHGYPLGVIEPFTGRSLRQLAVESRSLHRSQDMGAVQRLGQAFGGLVRLAGTEDPGAGSGPLPFSGVDTRLEAIVSVLPAGAVRRDLEAALADVARRAAAARGRLVPSDPGGAVEELAGLSRQLRVAGERIAGLDAGTPGRAAAADLVAEKLGWAGSALAAAAGVAIEAIADRESVAAGDALDVRAQVWATTSRPVETVAVELRSPAGWVAGDATRDAENEETAVNPFELPSEGEGMAEWRWRVTVPAEAPPTVPYFLLRGRPEADVYDWSGVAEAVRGLPYQPPPLVARFELTIAGEPVVLEREVVYRYGDQAFGERRRPLRAVPPLEVAARPALLLRPLGAAGGSEIEIVLTSNVERPLAGRLELSLPAGWRLPALEGAGDRFAIADPRGRQVVRMDLLAPPDAAPGAYPVAVAARLDDGGRYAASYPLVDYPHARPAAMPVAAEIEVRALDLAPPRVGRVGYVRGASDRVPELLREVGIPVELLDADALREADLTPFDAIVIGSRAYETDPVLRATNGRLLDWARAGGLLVVQYQQYQFVSGGFAPYPLTIARPHGRVTDESSPVRLLAPTHPIFTAPNAIGPADWEGWVQERGLYFAAEWDPAYTPLLALRDPGREEERGALLVAELGAGRYVYTGLSFFRELPAGVPGAFRLFANLLSWNRNP